MRFVLLVEGYTEHAAVGAFIKRWLDPQLKQPVGIQTVRHDGWQDLVKDAWKKAEMHLQEPRRGQEVIAVLALLDLYGPRYPEGIDAAFARQEWLRKRIRGSVEEPRFLVYCAIHETEAWLLSDPEIFPEGVRKSLRAKCSSPETVNHDTPPARLLNNCYRAKLRRDYRKVTDGKELFQRLDPNVAAQRCPNLHAMLQDLLRLARARGL